MRSTSIGTGATREHLLEAFLADTSEGFLVLDNSLRIVHFSAPYQQYHHLHTGASLKVGKLFSDVLPPEGLYELMPYLQKALDGEEARFAIEYPPVEGIVHKYEMHYSALKDRKGEKLGIKMYMYDMAHLPNPAGSMRTSEDLFKTLIQNATDAFQLTDIDFELQYVSDTVRNVLGYYPEDLVGTNGLDFVHPDDRDQVQEWFKKIRAEKGKSLGAEYRIKNKEGQYIWIENHSRNMLHNPMVKAIVMSYRNIQSKKAADFALVQAEQRLSLLLNNTEESFIILNSRLKVTAYNRAAQEHSPYFFRQELQSDLSILDMVNATDVEEMIELFEKVFDGDEVKRETEFVDENNDPHIFNHIFRPLFNDQKDIFGVFITSTDITKRKLAERQVQESEIRFRTIIGESFDAILIADKNANVFYVSPSISNVLGFSTEELIGMEGLGCIHPDDLQIALENFNTVASKPHHEKAVDIRMRNKEGEYVWIEAKGKNMFDNVYVHGVLVSLRDITERKRYEESVLFSELRFKGLVQSSADMISIVDEHSILQYSSPTLKYNGNDSAARDGQNIFNYVHADDLASVKEQFDKFLSSGDKQVNISPYKFQDHQGNYFWIESTVTNFLYDPAINGIVFNSRDITERKRLTEDLATNTERLKTAQKIAKLAYLEHDILNNSYFCSEQCSEVLGLPTGSHENLTLEIVGDAMHPDDRAQFKKQVMEAMTGISELNGEYRLLGRDGVEKVIQVIGGIDKTTAGVSSKFSLTLQDITDSKMAMLALQTMEGRFRSLFENSIDGVILSIPQGKVLSANPALCKMLGYTQEEIAQVSVADLLDVDSLEVNRLRKERNETGSFIGEISIRHKNGSLVPAEITSINMIDGLGELYHSTIVRDITEKKKIEIEQQSLTRELVKNNQDLQQFSFITSHNLRAPVANLISLLSLYNKQNLGDDFNGVLVDKFEEATLQLNQTLNDLIDVLVIKSNTNVDTQTLHFSDVFIDTKKNIDSLLNEQHGKIEADFTSTDTIEYNKIHLESIFLNLVSNAIRYRSPERAPHIKIKSVKEEHWTVVSFQDNGLGIDLKRYGGRMFGLYQRFHNSKEGKGLGLYMVKSQIMAMGGKIEVESEPKKGTTFKVYFKL